MKRLRVLLCLVSVPLLLEGQDLSSVLKAVETRYNRAKTLQVLFEQTFTAQGRPQRRESGELFLRKPGRMRWEYSAPPGKLFVSDGKQIYLYSPANNRVERMRVKESDDLRAPLGFLLGRLDFWRDFQRFVSQPEGEDLRIAAQPKSDRAPYQQVEFVVTPTRQIRYLKVLGQDHSVMEFRFSNERINPALPETLFRFVAPPGAEVVDAISEGGTP
ncbi:MAG: outer membrane lipoprotein carrier protein LolA [Bryobacteraceae bacterium]|nr:outer membrane lipoprotein carrier protein LolA [Bryobacteraceae bacterium]